MPFLLLCYFISFFDRINVAFAALQMNKAIGLTTAQYGFGAGLFFLTYCLFEIPSNLMLFRVGATRWIARIMLVWGVCAGGMAFVVGPHSFYTMRLLLGAAEAGFFPGVLFFLTLWFPTAYRGRIVSVFMAGVAISGLLGVRFPVCSCRWTVFSGCRAGSGCLSSKACRQSCWRRCVCTICKTVPRTRTGWHRASVKSSLKSWPPSYASGSSEKATRSFRL